MIRYQAIYDISVTLGAEAIDYPGDTLYSREPLLSLDRGDFCQLSALRLSAHAGTHLDAPAHFIAGAKTLDRYAIADFIFSAQVISIADPDSVKAEHLADLRSQAGQALLFRTENSRTGRCCGGRFYREYVYLSPEAARECVKKEVGLVGLDYVTIEQYENKDFKAHKILLEAGVLILESIDLRAVPDGQYSLFCLPLKLKGAEASPVRAVLMRWEHENG